MLPRASQRGSSPYPLQRSGGAPRSSAPSGRIVGAAEADAVVDQALQQQEFLVQESPVVSEKFDNLPVPRINKVITALEVSLELATIITHRSQRPELRLAVMVLKASLRAAKTVLARNAKSETQEDIYLVVDNTRCSPDTPEAESN